MTNPTLNHILENVLLLKDTLQAQKVTLACLDYQLNEVLLSINQQDLLKYDETSLENSDAKRN
jgi:hypothetical protein